MSACTDGRGCCCQSDHRRGLIAAAQRRQILAQHPIVGPEVVTPLRNAMRLINSDQRQPAFGEHLCKSRHAQPLRRNKQELQVLTSDSRRKPGGPRCDPGRSECAPPADRARPAWRPDLPSVQSVAKSPAPCRHAQWPAIGSKGSSLPRSASPATDRDLRWPRGTPLPGPP